MGLCEAGATSAQGLGGEDVSPGHPKSVMSFQEVNPAYLWNCPDVALQILSIQSHSLAPKFISRGEIAENQTTNNPFVGSHSLKPLRPGSYEISRGKNILFSFFPKELACREKAVQDRLCTWLSQVDREHGVHKPSAAWRQAWGHQRWV